MSNENKRSLQKDIKNFHFELPKELWMFLKQKAIKEETTMAKIIISLLEIAKKKDEKKC